MSDTNDPEDYAQATDRLEQEWETLADPETPDCSLALDMGALDPTGDKGALYRVIDWRQPRVAVFFRGPLPDVAPYFLPENRDALLGSRPEDGRSQPVDAFENRSWVDGDQRQRLQVATHQWKTDIVWHGEECPTYSYMLFEGQGR